MMVTTPTVTRDSSQMLIVDISSDFRLGLVKPNPVSHYSLLLLLLLIYMVVNIEYRYRYYRRYF